MALPSLDTFLATPEAATDLVGFAARLHMQTVTVRLSGRAAAAADPDLAGRIRAAFGSALLETASPASRAGDPCPWSPPCVFDALFRSKGRMTKRIDYPAPWLIACDPAGRDLDVQLSVFGVAAEWMPAAVEAFTRVLSGRIDWRQPAPFHPGRQGRRVRRLREEILGREVISLDGLELQRDEPHPPEAAKLIFLSPVTVGGRDTGQEPQAIFSEAGYRLEGIARWHGLTLLDAVDWPALRADLDQMHMAWEDDMPLRWERESRRQDRRIPMRGHLGSLVIQSPTDAPAHPVWPVLWPVLALGQAVRFGADTAFGCGRYRLFVA
eukprot:jgi/Tetstr1/435296/TSEL_024215.t1